MTEWWSYTLSDFLLFSGKTYYRLFELYNRDVWPAQLVALALGIAVLAAVLRGGRWRGPIVTSILAAGWLWVAWAFHAERYASVNWAARYFALGFALEAVLLLWTGLVRKELRYDTAHAAGAGLFLFALSVQPLIGPWLGRPWRQVEIAGMTPDPTVVATLGILLLASHRPAWKLLLIPLIWCLISGATLYALGAPDAVVMPLAGLFSLLMTAQKALSKGVSR